MEGKRSKRESRRVLGWCEHLLRSRIHNAFSVLRRPCANFFVHLTTSHTCRLEHLRCVFFSLPVFWLPSQAAHRPQLSPSTLLAVPPSSSNIQLYRHTKSILEDMYTSPVTPTPDPLDGPSAPADSAS